MHTTALPSINLHLNLIPDSPAPRSFALQFDTSLPRRHLEKNIAEQSHAPRKQHR